MNIESEPLSRRGRVLFILNIVVIILMFLFGIYYYFTLPDTIPAHFDTSGNPDAYGSRNQIILLPIALSIAPVILLLLTHFRFILINRYPYLINLPAFMMNIGRLPKSERAIWINRFFEGLLAFGLFIAAYLLIMEIILLNSTAEGSVPAWFTLYVILTPYPGLGFFIHFMWKLSRELKERVESL